MAPVTVQNGLLLLAQSLIYFAFMAVLFRLRAKLGLGVLTCALGTLHFLETYLASSFYVATPVGVVSPGSSVLFSGKLLFLLLIYIKDDAGAVRQPIYGILAGNALTLLLGLVLRLHDVFVFSPDARPAEGFIETIGGLMLWGTTLLYVDAIMLILLYERLGRAFRDALAPRIFVSLAAVLAFDQAGFYLALRWLAGLPIEAFYAGLMAKTCAALVFSLLAGLYLRHVEPDSLKVGLPLGDVFDTLTYRERFEALAEHTTRDRTTMLLNRDAFTADLQAAFDPAAGREMATLLLVEVDAAVFDDVHRRLGRSNSEALLRTVSRSLEEVVHDRDEVYRLGPRQFAMICRCPPALAVAMVDRLRLDLVNRSVGYSTRITLSIGGAGGLPGGGGRGIFALADAGLAEARAAGGDGLRMFDTTLPDPGVNPGGGLAHRGR